MDCQELAAQIQDKTAECYDKHQEADDCDAELTDMWLLWQLYCEGA